MTPTLGLASSAPAPQSPSATPLAAISFGPTFGAQLLAGEETLLVPSVIELTGIAPARSNALALNSLLSPHFESVADAGTPRLDLARGTSEAIHMPSPGVVVSEASVTTTEDELVKIEQPENTGNPLAGILIAFSLPILSGYMVARRSRIRPL